MALASDAVFQKIGARLQKIDPNDRKIQHIYKFIIKKDGAVVKTWMLDLKNVKVYVGDDPAECTLTCEDSVMTALGSGTMKAQEALAQDKLDIDGQLDLVMLLSPYVSSL